MSSKLARWVDSELALAPSRKVVSREVIAKIEGLLASQPGPIVVAIDGGSGAGKSTLAQLIASELETALIELDDFFSAEIPDGQWDQLSVEERLDCVFDWQRVRESAIEPLLAGETARWYVLDFESGLLPDGTYGRKQEPIEREPAKVILIDGAYSGHPKLADLVDLAILVDVPVGNRHAWLAAREDPSFLKSWHRRWDPVEGYYFSQVRPTDSYDLVVGPW